MKSQGVGRLLGAALAIFAVLLSGCAAQNGNSDNRSGSQVQVTPQPSAPPIDEACHDMLLKPKDVAEILKAPVTQAVYAEGETLTGYPMGACYYTVDQQSPGGEQSQRTLEFIFVPDGHGHWNRITHDLTGWDSLDLADVGFVTSGSAMPTIIFRKGKKVFSVTLLAEKGTDQSHKLLRQLGKRAAARL